MAYRGTHEKFVRCCGCGCELQVDKADMCAMGYRCASCTFHAEHVDAASQNIDSPNLYVPSGALIAPVGATPNPGGTVSCVQCGQQIPLSQADIVGEGYRCGVCSHNATVALAHGQSDVASHLSKRDRRELSSVATPANVGGVVMLVGGICLFAATGGSAGIFLTIGGIISLIASAART